MLLEESKHIFYADLISYIEMISKWNIPLHIKKDLLKFTEESEMLQILYEEMFTAEDHDAAYQNCIQWIHDNGARVMDVWLLVQKIVRCFIFSFFDLFNLLFLR